MELEIEYSHRVIYADENSAELEIRIERINTYTEGKFYGSISSIPHELSTVHARALGRWQDRIRSGALSAR